MEKKNKHRRSIIIIVCAVMILIAAASAAVFQRNNINAIISFIRYSDGELEQQLAENEETGIDAINALSGFSIRPVTEEEQKALEDGSLTPEELADRLVNAFHELNGGGVNHGSGGSDAAKPAQGSGGESEAECDRKVSAIIARVYALKGQYTGALGGLEAQARAEFNALPPEKRNVSGAAGMLSRYLAKGTALEHECDGKMDGILSELESVLKAYGRDTSLVDTVAGTYAREKSLKKAYYMSMIR